MIYTHTGPLELQLECLPIVQETWVQFQVKSYQKLKKGYLIPPCLTLTIIRYGSRVSRAIQGKEQCPPLHFSVVTDKREPLSANLYIYVDLALNNQQDLICRKMLPVISYYEFLTCTSGGIFLQKMQLPKIRDASSNLNACLFFISHPWR